LWKRKGGRGAKEKEGGESRQQTADRSQQTADRERLTVARIFSSVGCQAN
jgi:hypothetical protein